jgi:Cu-processing system permease protein
MRLGPVVVIARKEAWGQVRNYWFPVVSMLLLVLTVGVTRLGFSFVGEEQQVDIRAILLSLVHLQMYLIPLLSFILVYGGILSEREQGSLDLLLSYPLGYADIILGKWLGYSFVYGLAIATAMGLSLVVLRDVGLGFGAMAWLSGLALALALACNSIGLLISTLSRDRTTVIACCIVLWIFFVFVFDLGFVALMVLTNGDIPDRVIQGMLLLNPVETFRIVAIIRLLPEDAVDLFGLGEGLLNTGACLLALALWALTPLLIAMYNPAQQRRKSA